MYFINTIHRILNKTLNADPALGPVYLSNSDLSDAYMRLWFRMDNVSSVSFLIPKKTPANPQLVCFHLSLPMGYTYSVAYFCTAIETITNTKNTATACLPIPPTGYHH